MAGIITIRLETDNNVSIKTVNITGKTIKMLSFLRTAYEIVKANYKKDMFYFAAYELAKPGIYILIGEDNTIYIGQSDSVLERLNNHFANEEKKEYWVNTMVFMADGTAPLNISQIKYLESRLIDMARKAATVEVGDEAEVLKLKNKQIANIPNISVNDLIVADNFMQDILMITKALGISYFDIKVTKQRDNKIENESPVFVFKNKYVDAQMVIIGDKYVLLTGAMIIKEEYPACKDYIKTKRKLLISNGLFDQTDKHYISKENISFDSASTAASVVSGRSANGRIEWKTTDGKMLKDLGL